MQPDRDDMNEPESKERLRLWLRLLGTTRSIETVLREKLRIEFGTTLPRFDVMAALSRYDDGLKMSELSTLLKVSNGNVTNIVDRLVDEGTVLRESVPGDRRAWRVRLTRKGQEEFERQAVVHEEWVNTLLGVIDPEESKDISATLARVLRETRKDR